LTNKGNWDILEYVRQAKLLFYLCQSENGCPKAKENLFVGRKRGLGVKF